MIKWSQRPNFLCLTIWYWPPSSSSLPSLDFTTGQTRWRLQTVLSFCPFRFSGGKQRTHREYLLADQRAAVLPVAFSLMASFMSAITLLGVTMENYTYGTQFVMINLSYLLSTPVAAYIFLPVFHGLQCTSVYRLVNTQLIHSVLTIGFKVLGNAVWIYHAHPSLGGIQPTNGSLHGHSSVRSFPCSLGCHWPQLHGIRDSCWSGLHLLLQPGRHEGRPDDRCVPVSTYVCRNLYCHR